MTVGEAQSPVLKPPDRLSDLRPHLGAQDLEETWGAKSIGNLPDIRVDWPAPPVPCLCLSSACCARLCAGGREARIDIDGPRLSLQGWSQRS